jgi:hypothetical protein
MSIGRTVSCLLILLHQHSQHSTYSSIILTVPSRIQLTQRSRQRFDLSHPASGTIGTLAIYSAGLVILPIAVAILEQYGVAAQRSTTPKPSCCTTAAACTATTKALSLVHERAKPPNRCRDPQRRIVQYLLEESAAAGLAFSYDFRCALTRLGWERQLVFYGKRCSI